MPLGSRDEDVWLVRAGALVIEQVEELGCLPGAVAPAPDRDRPKDAHLLEAKHRDARLRHSVADPGERLYRAGLWVSEGRKLVAAALSR